jgi:hypothetical protein
LKEYRHRVASHVHTANFQKGSKGLAFMRLPDRYVQIVKKLPSGIGIIFISFLFICVDFRN